MKPIVALCCTLIIAATACKKTTPNMTTQGIDSAGTLLFGMTNPMCPTPGSCGMFYLIQNGVLLRDSAYYMVPQIFFLPKMPDSAYVLAKPLIDSIPAYLFSHPNTSIGCPGCADGEIVRIWANTGNATIKWDINSNVNQLPVEIRAYVTHVEQVLDKIK